MKNSLFKIAFFMIAASLFTSCATTQTYQVSMLSEYTNMFVGKSHKEIVSALGAPDRQTTDGGGGTILIYEQTTTTSTSNSVAAAYNVNYFTKTYTPGVNTSTSTSTNTSFVHIYIDESGVCYNVKTNHQKLVEREIPKETRKENRRSFWKIMGISVGAGGLLGVLIGVIAGFAG